MSWEIPIPEQTPLVVTFEVATVLLLLHYIVKQQLELPLEGGGRKTRPRDPGTKEDPEPPRPPSSDDHPWPESVPWWAR